MAQNPNKREYRKLCKLEKSIPIFSQAWWLDAVCGIDEWGVVLVKNNGDDIVAAMPYYMKEGRFGLKHIIMPPLTQTMGPWLKYPANQKEANRLSFDKRIMKSLIDGLPEFDSFKSNFHYSLTNWLPFYWHAFNQTTRYTYVIEDLSDLEAVWKGFSRAKRKNIKKAQKIVKIAFDLSATAFYENHKMTLAKQGENINYSYDLFERIYNAGYSKGSSKTIYATDSDGNIHAALFVIWDSQSAYDLISTIDPDFRNSGAATLLVRKIIEYVSSMTTKFDFEGSMIEGVEKSFRQFGATQKPYFAIKKINSRIWRFKQGLDLIKGALLDR